MSLKACLCLLCAGLNRLQFCVSVFNVSFLKMFFLFIYYDRDLKLVKLTHCFQCEFKCHVNEIERQCHFSL